MKLGPPVELPELPPVFDDDGRFDHEALKAHQRWLEQYAEEHDVMRHGWADGVALYEVRGSTLHHIPSFGVYNLPTYVIRGLRKADVQRMLWRPSRWRSLMKGR